ncbi:uncharacterized protein CXorf58 homolog [Hypomesus transpacificus]|uniref:uncharacterized protein CXorf58 homolog n=1 Tax=Hypomesus transpacificus TaxID=137520 RepID=UPI001F0871B8|nr:uncharacterized protein CXorf58 homolog [Hypomesus transpacificus]
MHCEVRLRFSGSKFPPVIVFKIFHLGGGRQYISGKSVFRPNHLGTTDTRRMMGSRIFLNHILADEIQRQGRTVVDTSDVACMRDYMQYTNHVDELPAYLGGRENTWRSLSLKGLPQRGTATDRLQQKRLLSLWRDGGQNPRLQRSPATSPSSIVSTERSVLNPTPILPICHSSRKGSTTHRMRQLHLLQKNLGEEDNNGEWRTMEQDVDSQENFSIGGLEESVSTRMAVPLVEEKGSSDVSFSEWEEEADELYTWTKQLDISDIDTVPYLQEK